MAGLSAREKTGCRRLLELLDSQDVFSVAETVTNRIIHVSSREEAIDAILTYSQSAAELLKRRKVHRNAIFKYLAAENITVPPSGDKHLLIDRAIEYWRGPKVQQMGPSIQEASTYKPEEVVKPHPEPLDCKLLVLIEDIIRLSQSAEELLNRKLVCKRHILHYLNSQGLSMQMRRAKLELKQAVINLWRKSGNPMNAVGHLISGVQQLKLMESKPEARPSSDPKEEKNEKRERGGGGDGRGERGRGGQGGRREGERGGENKRRVK